MSCHHRSTWSELKIESEACLLSEVTVSQAVHLCAAHSRRRQHSPLRKPVPQRGLLPRLEVLRAPVRLHELELVAPHARERGAARLLKRRAGQPGRIDGELRADDAALRLAALAAKSAQQRFGTAFERASDGSWSPYAGARAPSPRAYYMSQSVVLG